MKNDQLNKQNMRAQYNYRKRKSAEEMKHQVITFALMIFLTIIAFIAVGYSNFSASFVVPFILLLAVIQVIFQLYYFMHANQKGHEMPMVFMYSAMFVAFITVLCFVTIIWW
jgi:cytochrome c oxidase subunit IV